MNHWVGLTRFLEDSRIQLDTNTVERGIRPIVLERRTLSLNQEDFSGRWDLLPKGGDLRCRSRIRLICVSALSAMSVKVIRAARPRRISGCRFPSSSTW